MSRISIPASIDAAPEASQPLLNQVKSQLGSAPNIFRLIAKSPAALEGHLGLAGALGKGSLPAATRERIALAIGELNGCGYCLSAHSYVAAHLSKLSAEEIAANRRGRSTDAKADAAVVFAVQVAETRGRVADSDLTAVRAAGYDDAQIIEIVQHVALNVWTNYLNELARTEIDFPVADGVAA
ncbi:MAG: alkylhydroperoxidase [Rhodobacteraceae bacterium]|nr:alkylhydroperoxidase [Paracoccaceae bacterium]